MQLVRLFVILLMNPTISLENEIVAQGLMNTKQHQGYPGYPRSWQSPYETACSLLLHNPGLIDFSWSRFIVL